MQLQHAIALLARFGKVNSEVLIESRLETITYYWATVRDPYEVSFYHSPGYRNWSVYSIGVRDLFQCHYRGLAGHVSPRMRHHDTLRGAIKSVTDFLCVAEMADLSLVNVTIRHCGPWLEPRLICTHAGQYFVTAAPEALALFLASRQMERQRPETHLLLDWLQENAFPDMVCKRNVPVLTEKGWVTL